ncbi:MAG: carboxypeptidase-like regulatory domain-containing protein [Nocardioides sp.]|uniref:carboxypeptidase-like regulatory domain-containing protein n=1 Tax=Nocardioides sp. TaxID=35761 RepID=UPI003267267F
MAPANAASVVTGGVTDGFGNPIGGYLDAYLQDPDSGSYFFEDRVYVDNNGYIEDTLDTDGSYKFEFNTYTGYEEWFKDAADEATAAPINVAAGAPVALGAWTIDQPYVVGTVTNAAGKPLSASIRAYDATTGDSVSSTGADVKGSFKIPTQTGPVKLSFDASDYALEYYADAADIVSALPVTGTATGANLGNIVLAPSGSISGQVTSDAGAPLEFVEVSTDDGQSDYTDKNGVYTIEDVSTGANTVSFFDPIGEYAFEYFNNVTDEDLATPVTVGVGQAVGGINAGLAAAPADTTTKTVEIAGAVKDNLGAPVVGAVLTAYNTPASPSDRQQFETVLSNRQGNYAFTELEKVAGENQFKIVADASVQGDDNAFALFGSWYGGGQDYERAPAVTVTPGTPFGPVDFELERAGGIAGSVTGLAGTPLSPSVSVVGVPDGAGTFTGVDFKTDSTFEGRALRAGTYKVRFSDFSGFHAAEWWKDKANVDDAVLITVKSGQMVGGLNAVLGNQLSAVERPSISSDYAWVGKALSAKPGSWTVQTNTDFTYQWLVGNTVVGQGESYTPTTANIGDRLTLRVTAENGRLIGTATSTATTKVGYQPKIKVKVKGDKASLKVKAPPVKAKKVKGTVVVKEIVKVKDDGTIKYKKIAKGKIKKGKGTISLSKLKKGKHKLVFFFTGKGKVGSNDVTKKVKG